MSCITYLVTAHIPLRIATKMWGTFNFPQKFSGSRKRRHKFSNSRQAKNPPKSEKHYILKIVLFSVIILALGQFAVKKKKPNRT